MSWMWIGKDGNDWNVYINEDKGIVAFDQQGGAIPSAEFEGEEFGDIESLIAILCKNNVTCCE